MDWFSKEVKDNSLKKSLSNKPMTNFLYRIGNLIVRNRRTIVSAFMLALIIYFISMNYVLSSKVTKSNVLPAREEDKNYFEKRTSTCQSFKEKRHTFFRDTPMQLSIVIVAPYRQDDGEKKKYKKKFTRQK